MVDKNDKGGSFDGGDDEGLEPDSVVCQFPPRKSRDPDVEKIGDDTSKSLHDLLGPFDPLGLHTFPPGLCCDLCPPDWKGLDSDQIGKLEWRKMMRKDGIDSPSRFDKWKSVHHKVSTVLSDPFLQKFMVLNQSFPEGNPFLIRVFMDKADDDFLIGMLEKYYSNEEERHKAPVEAVVCARILLPRLEHLLDRFQAGDFSNSELV